MNKARVYQFRGELEQAIVVFRETKEEIDQAGDPRLSAYARQSLLSFLTQAGRHEEAAQLLPEVQSLFQETAELLDQLKLRWAEASIAQGLGRPAEAESLYREVRTAFLALDKGYDAALVSLDLAALLAEQGRTAELKSLAAEILAAFSARGVAREAMASLLLFHQACAEESATLEMIQRLAAEFRRSRRGAGRAEDSLP